MNEYLYANYHAHTTRCHHAGGTEREYIEAAIASGIRVFGFSDHVPFPFSDGYVSGIRMTMDEAKEYVDCIRALAEEYKDQIRILVGFEAEYLPEYFDRQIAYFDELGINYLIMGQHFVKGEKTGPYSGTPSSDETLLKDYVDSILCGMQTGRFSYLAHPDLIHFTGDDDVYRKEMTRLCCGLKELHIPLEINLLGIETHRHYPRKLFWEIAGETGCDVICGIDAHQPYHIGNRDNYEKALALVEKYQLHLLDRLAL